MFIYYDFPECEDFEFEITPDRFRDFIENQYSKSDLIVLISNFYWDKFDSDVQEEIIEETGYNPDKPHESDYEAYNIFCNYLYDYVDDFKDGLSLFYEEEAHNECIDDINYKIEFDGNDSKWY